MNSLDNDMMSYFYDEMEKQAILKATAKGIWAILKASGRAAKSGATGFGKAMSKGSTMGNQTRTKILKDGTEKLVTNKDPMSARHVLGAIGLGVGTVHATKGAVNNFGTARAAQKTLATPSAPGNVNLNY